MNKKIKIFAASLAVAVTAAVTVYAAYDSNSDPIVSLSYLTDIFKPELKNALSSELNSAVSNAKDSLKTDLTNHVNSQVNSQVSSQVDSVESRLSAEIDSAVKAAESRIEEKLEAEYAETIDALRAKLDSLSNVYESVTLNKGQRLTANAACEIVLVSGSATTRSSAADSGLIDCTDGIVLYDGQNVPANHKLLVPDNGDGRGVTATGTAQLLVKGGYKIG